MHGLGSRPLAPESDAAGRGDAGGTPLTARRCRVGPCPATWIPRLAPTRLRLEPIRAESGRLGPYRAKLANSSPYSSFPTRRRLLEWTQAMAEAAAAMAWVHSSSSSSSSSSPTRQRLLEWTQAMAEAVFFFFFFVLNSLNKNKSATTTQQVQSPSLLYHPFKNRRVLIQTILIFN